MYWKFIIVSAGLFGAELGPVRSVAAQGGGAADTLVVSLEEARAMAARANPELLASSWRPAAARGDVRAARTLRFNPELAFESRSPGAGIASRYEAELGLSLEVAGQPGLRVEASEAGYQAASRRFLDDGRLILREVERAYHRLVAAEQREALADQISALNSELEAAVTAQRAEGEVSLLEANLAGIEAARARARALEARSARTTAALELRRLLGLRTDTLVVRTEGVAAERSAAADLAGGSSVEEALTARPDLLAAEQEIERARQEARLARREAFPNLRIAALATREDPLVDPRFGVSAGIELPLFNRNQGLTQRRQAEIAETEQARRATELRVREEVESALRAYESARREVALLEAEMLGPIRQNQALLEIAFREGKIDLASLLLLRNQLLDAELTYWEAWERRAIAHTNLAAATGEILEGVDLIEGGER
jgi:cobalt-zinc-cadmium efflux system outer membrane protein